MTGGALDLLTPVGPGVCWFGIRMVVTTPSGQTADRRVTGRLALAEVTGGREACRLITRLVLADEPAGTRHDVVSLTLGMVP